MAAIFAYARVSTGSQSTENQRLEIEGAGYAPAYFFSDTVSGKCPASRRPAFQEMMGKIRRGETLIVAKLDRLGRDSVDVLQTVRQLQDKGVSVIVLQLGNVDLTSPAGKLLLSMLSALAEMERDLLIERTQAGLQRAKAEGKQLGRKPKTTAAQKQTIRERLQAGETVSALAREFAVSRATIISIRDERG